MNFNSARDIPLTSLVAWTVIRPEVVPADLIRFVMTPPGDATLSFAGGARDLTISPDGTQVAYVSRNSSGLQRQIYLRPIDRLVGVPPRGGEDGAGPFMSPDGEWVGFIRGGALHKVSFLGGPAVTLAEFAYAVVGVSWGTDDQIVFGTFGGGAVSRWRQGWRA